MVSDIKEHLSEELVKKLISRLQLSYCLKRSYKNWRLSEEPDLPTLIGTSRRSFRAPSVVRTCFLSIKEALLRSINVTRRLEARSKEKQAGRTQVSIYSLLLI